MQYEGEELEKNVYYTGAAPNQQAIPAVEYLMSEDGGGAKRFVLLGTDYVYPRTTNKILRAFLHSKGVKDSDIDEVYTPFGHSDYQTIVANIKKFATGGKTAVISTINGDSNVPFYKELGNAGLKATDVPVVAFSVGEEELRGVDTKPLVGHLAAWNYFESIKTPVNTDFIAKWKAYAKAKNLPNAATVVTNDPMEATYIGIHMWKQAVEQAKSTDVDKVIAAMGGQTFSSPSGFEIMMDKTNHHLHKPVYIGEIKADGQFNVVWKSKGPIRAQPWSPYIPATKASRASEGDGRHAQRCDRTLPASSPARPVPGLAGAARGGGRRRPGPAGAAGGRRYRRQAACDRRAGRAARRRGRGCAAGLGRRPALRGAGRPRADR